MESFAIPGAGGIIEKVIEGNPYILLQNRVKGDRPLENGLIEIPAGKIRAFENIYDCLRREVKEETGLEIVEIEGEKEAVIHEANGYRVINYIPFSSSQNLVGNYPIMVQVFLCRATGELRSQSEESNNFRWVSLSELQDMLETAIDRFYPMHVTCLRKYIAMKNMGSIPLQN